MGKKKGSKKGSKKGKKGSKKGAKASASEVANAGPTQLELSLRLELQRIEKDLTLAKRDTEEARHLNEILHDEISKTQEENAEYESYIKKKSAKEKELIEQLSDHNKREMEQLESERNQLDLHSQRIKKELNETIQIREEELNMTNKQIEELAHVQTRRDEQEREIASLQANIKQLKQEHFDALQALKSKFLADKRAFQRSAGTRVQRLEARAEPEAVACLTKHSSLIKTENQRLRNKLLTIMSNNKQLGKEESLLRSQNDELRRQIELNTEIVRMVDTRKSLVTSP